MVGGHSGWERGHGGGGFGGGGVTGGVEFTMVGVHTGGMSQWGWEVTEMGGSGQGREMTTLDSKPWAYGVGIWPGGPVSAPLGD